MSACALDNTTEKPTPSAPLYDRVGGSDAVSAVVEVLYEKILADVNLQRFFVGTDMKKLKRHQVAPCCLRSS